MKHIIFDYNGPIIDGRKYYEDRSRRVAKLFGAKWTKGFELEWKDWYHRLSVNRLNIDDYYVNISKTLGKNIPKGVENLFIQEERLADDKIPFYLDKIKTEFPKVRMSLLTNYYSPWVYPVLRENDIEKYFDPIVVSDKIWTRKPKPRAYNIIVKMLETTPDNCLYIGDSDRDLIAAKKVGMIPIFIAGEDDHTELFQKSTIKNIGEVVRFL